MVLSRHSFSNGRFHETRKGRKHIDGWIDVPVVQLTIDVDLSFGNVASQIGDRMGDIW